MWVCVVLSLSFYVSPVMNWRLVQGQLGWHSPPPSYNMKQYCTIKYDRKCIVQKSSLSHWLFHHSLNTQSLPHTIPLLDATLSHDRGAHSITLCVSGMSPLFNLVFFLIVVVGGVYTDSCSCTMLIWASVLLCLPAVSFWHIDFKLQTPSSSVCIYLNPSSFESLLKCHYESHVFIMSELCSVRSFKSQTLSAMSVSLLKQKFIFLRFYQTFVNLVLKSVSRIIRGPTWLDMWDTLCSLLFINIAVLSLRAIGSIILMLC